MVDELNLRMTVTRQVSANLEQIIFDRLQALPEDATEDQIRAAAKAAIQEGVLTDVTVEEVAPYTLYKIADDFDIADMDLFSCDDCGICFDVEDSIVVDDVWRCPRCDKKRKTDEQ